MIDVPCGCGNIVPAGEAQGGKFIVCKACGTLVQVPLTAVVRTQASDRASLAVVAILLISAAAGFAYWYYIRHKPKPAAAAAPTIKVLAASRIRAGQCVEAKAPGSDRWEAMQPAHRQWFLIVTVECPKAATKQDFPLEDAAGKFLTTPLGFRTDAEPAFTLTGDPPSGRFELLYQLKDGAAPAAIKFRDDPPVRVPVPK